MADSWNNHLSKLPASHALDPETDPLRKTPPTVVRDGDYVVLVFGDGRQLFAQCVTGRGSKGKASSVRINKRSYPSSHLVGLPYGAVLELGSSGLVLLPEGEGILPNLPTFQSDNGGTQLLEDDEADADDTTFPSIVREMDNRNLLDNNKSQNLDYSQVRKLISEGTEGATMVEKLIENSATFHSKTEFSKAKYIARKQKKYQLRCRIVRSTPSSVCEALYYKDPRKMLNMREDTLGQILGYSNVSAGCQVLVMETCMGVVTGSLAQRMGGYGKILSIYSGQQPKFTEMIARFNLSFGESQSIKWLHSGDVFPSTDCDDDNEEAASPSGDNDDPERDEREALEWPCPLQAHTRRYLEGMKTDRERTKFLDKRCARFARKLTRHTGVETKDMLLARPCDSVVVVARYDPTATLLALLPFLAPSSPFVVYCEYIEPLARCFRELQQLSLTINIRLSDTWMREYQVLPGRTHPSMTMSQSGGFLLHGIKLCPKYGRNELDENLLKEIRESMGSRYGRKAKSKNGQKQSKRSRDDKGDIPNGTVGTENDDDIANKRARGDESV